MSAKLTPETIKFNEIKAELKTQLKERNLELDESLVNQTAELLNEMDGQLREYLDSLPDTDLSLSDIEPIAAPLGPPKRCLDCKGEGTITTLRLYRWIRRECKSCARKGYK